MGRSLQKGGPTRVMGEGQVVTELGEDGGAITEIKRGNKGFVYK